MNILLNNNINPSKLITMNNVPTIVKLDSFGSGDKAKLTITISSGGVSLNTTYQITINDITITSTFNETDAIGSVWWVSTNTNTSYQKAMAYYMQQALLNTSLSNNYNISISDNVVTLEAKEIGSQYNFNNYNTNASFISFNSSNGSSSDLLTNSKVILNLYAESRPSKQNTINGSSSALPHIVTLEKYYYKDGISFDISPILSQVTEDGNVTEYNVSAAYIKNGQYTSLGSLNHNYCVNGYSVNQGLYYIPQFNGMYLAQNVFRGTSKPTYNNSILYYIDDEPITMSFFNTDLSNKTLTIKYYNSAMNLISTNDINYTPSKTLDEFSFIPNQGAYYIDVINPYQGAIRYTNVKPIDYINKGDYQMIYWRNSYGGTSFVPLTFNRTEERETEIEEYRKQSFDMYESDMKELNKVYSRTLEYEVELKSHYIQKDGTWIFYDLLHSYSAWTYVNGVKYAIIINEVQVNETNVNDIYQVSVKYKYSLNDNFY